MNENAIMKKLDILDVICDRIDGMDERLDKMDERFDKMDERLDKMDERFDKMDERFDKMDERFDKMDERFDKMDERLDNMDERLDNMDERLGNVENDVRDIRLTIENDIKKGIDVVIEGHMDLSRKLNEALKINADRLTEHEIMKYKINHLDSEIIKINDKLRPLSISSPALQ